MRNRKDEVVKVLNKMLELCEPITYDEFNIIIKAKNIGDLIDYEEEYPEVGISSKGISTLSIIATITDILCDERLGFIFNIDTGIIEGVTFDHTC